MTVFVALMIILGFAGIGQHYFNKSHAAVVPAGFVTTAGTNFSLNGQPFKFVGFNLFDAAATDFYKCGGWTRYTDAELDTELAYLHNNGGVTVLRVWMYQTYTKGGTDWTGTDKIIALAKKNNIKLIAAFEDGPGYCSTGGNGIAKWQYLGDTYYTNGYKVPYGSAPKSLREYAPLVATHYRNEPTIMAWSLVNEPDTSAKDATSKGVLVNFVNDVGALVKAADPNHLLTYGGQSNGQSGASGSDYVAVNNSQFIDFGEIHNYHYQDPDTVALPGSSDGKTLPNPNSAACLLQFHAGSMIACSIAQAIQVVKKPVIIGEAGIVARDATARATRAGLFDAKMSAAFSSGVSGYLIWQINKVVDSEGFDVLTTTSDPLFAVMKKYSSTSTVTPTPVSTPSPAPTPISAGTATINDTVLGNGINQFNYSATGWSTNVGAPAAYQGDNHYSAVNGAMVTIQFDGNQIKYYSLKNSNTGVAGISIDGGAESLVDTYASARQDDALIYTSPVLGSGTHSLKVRVTGTKNTASASTIVAADRVDVLTGSTQTNGNGDANSDNRVNALDLSILLTHDGKVFAPADFNRDGSVGSADLAILLGRWTW